MESQVTPRATAPYLDSYVGRNVTVVGKVVQLRGDMAVIDADGNVTVHLNREAHLSPGSAAQIIGKVNPDLSIRVLSAVDLGNGVDFNLCQQVVERARSRGSLGSVSIIWPSDSVSQCNANGSRRWGDQNSEDQDTSFDDDDLAEEMSKLDISSLPPSPLATMRVQPGPEPSEGSERNPRQKSETDFNPGYQVSTTPRYRSLNSIGISAWDNLGIPGPSPPTISSRIRGRGFGRGATAKKYQNHQRGEHQDLGLSTELVNAIFCGITRKNGGRWFAQLSMDDSGRWRIVRTSRPPDVFPTGC